MTRTPSTDDEPSEAPRFAFDLAQRLVIVVAYGVAILVLWGWIEVEGWRQLGADSLSTTYGSETGVVLNGGRELRTNVGLRLIAQLALVAIWTLPSLWLLRRRTPQAARRR